MPQGIITKNLKKHSIRTQEIRERAKYPTLKKMGKSPNFK